MLDGWLEDHVRLSKAETTYHSYVNIVKGIPAWFKKMESKEVTTARTVMTTGNYAAVMLIAYTGMRAREVTALRWSDVDFERKRIMVMRTAIETAGGYSFSQMKGKKVSVITIPDVAIEELVRIRREQKYDQVRLGWRNEEDLICTGVTCAYLWHSGLRRRYHLTLESAGLPSITLHGLRHTHATLLLEVGTHAKVI